MQLCRTDACRPVLNIYVVFKKNQTANILRQFEKSKSSTYAGSGKQTETREEKLNTWKDQLKFGLCSNFFCWSLWQAGCSIFQQVLEIKDEGVF